jgi:hypothetical protein
MRLYVRFRDRRRGQTPFLASGSGGMLFVDGIAVADVADHHLAAHDLILIGHPRHDQSNYASAPKSLPSDVQEHG